MALSGPTKTIRYLSASRAPDRGASLDSIRRPGFHCGGCVGRGVAPHFEPRRFGGVFLARRSVGFLSEEESPAFAAGLKWEKGPAIATGRDGPAERGPRQI